MNGPFNRPVAEFLERGEVSYAHDVRLDEMAELLMAGPRGRQFCLDASKEEGSEGTGLTAKMT